MEAWKQYQSWLHYEDVFVPAEHAAFAEQVQEEFFSRQNMQVCHALLIVL